MVGALLLALQFPALATPSVSGRLVPAGTGQAFRYWIEAESVRRQGPVVHYRLHGLGASPETRYASFEAEVGVRCDTLQRVEYVSTTRGSGTVHTSTAHDMQDTVSGSRAAAELTIACELAGRSPATAEPDAGRAMRDESVSAWSGTAFAVTPLALVTNHHVVQGCTDIRVVREGFNQPAQLLASDPVSDLAALVVPQPVLQALELGAGGNELGESVAVLGYPLANVLGTQLRVTTGVVSALTGIAGDRTTLQISAAVNSGNSGGPLLDAHGGVTGVVSRKLDARSGVENVGFAVRVEELRAFLRTSGLLDERPARRRVAASAGGLAQVVRKAAPSIFTVQCGRRTQS